MARGTWHYSVSALLTMSTTIALLFVMYPRIWLQDKYRAATFVVTTALFAVCGMVLRRGHSRGAVLGGAVMGGMCGAVLAVALHFFFGYTKLEHFEDEGLGFLHGVLAFAPYALAFGAGVGGLLFKLAEFAWLIARRYLRRTRRDIG